MPELSPIVNADADISGLQWLEYLFLLGREQGWEQKTIVLSWNEGNSTHSYYLLLESVRGYCIYSGWAPDVSYIPPWFTYHCSAYEFYCSVYLVFVYLPSPECKLGVGVGGRRVQGLLCSVHCCIPSAWHSISSINLCSMSEWEWISQWTKMASIKRMKKLDPSCSMIWTKRNSAHQWPSWDHSPGL